MALQDIQKNFIFPRIPLSFTLPEEYPEVATISNVSVTPEISGFGFNRDELEIQGTYQVTVSYFKPLIRSDEGPAPVRACNCEDFFGSLKLQADGCIAEYEEPSRSGEGKDTHELYTVSFTKPFHTFVDLEFIHRPRSFRPSIVVEKVDLAPADGRGLKGELVFSLTNRNRRNW